MADRIRIAVEIYPCDLLFIHRDSDKQPPELRYSEIGSAIRELEASGFSIPHLCVVPIRMTEAWLLIDEPAIRRAAANPNGTHDLHIPKPKHLEDLPDPKSRLHDTLREATGKHGRRRASFDVREAAGLVPGFIASFAALRQLSAFARLEEDLRQLAPISRPETRPPPPSPPPANAPGPKPSPSKPKPSAPSSPPSAPPPPRPTSRPPSKAPAPTASKTSSKPSPPSARPAPSPTAPS